MTQRRYLIVIEGGDDANYSAYAPDVPGCVATAATLDECEREMLPSPVLGRQQGAGEREHSGMSPERGSRAATGATQ